MSKEKEIIDTPEEITTKVHWQWIKGDDSGRVVTFKDEGLEWITFNEGGRIATGLRDEFLQQLNPDLVGEFVKDSPSIDPLAMGGSDLHAPTASVVPEEVIIKTVSPIRVLFNKQKKNNKVKLLLEFPVNIPSKDLYKLMSTSFDKNEVNEQLESFILDQLSEDEILDCLYNSVQSLIESKYKGE